MDCVFDEAARWGIEIEHFDGLGRRWAVQSTVLAGVLAAMGREPEPAPPTPFLETARPLPSQAYQGRKNLPPRSWVLAVQLYGVRSRRNWGHGDFTDLANLIDLAGTLGAAGIGLNPLHALFDDRAEEASPYFPTSRFFLNPLYIDIAAIEQFPRTALAELKADIEALRARELVDYAGVAKLKTRALSLAYDAFRASATADRQEQFESFRRERGAILERFAAFELLRRRFGTPWWDWSPEWQRPAEEALRGLRSSSADELAFVAYVQWIADEQLAACRDQARRLGLPIGLYLDLAVGVRSDGFDAWNDQDFVLRTVEIGAPPDLLNTKGQRWGLAGCNPVNLIRRHCEPFRDVLRASMRYAGALRLDHILGLKRLYLIPNGIAAQDGAYVRFPFEQMLVAAAAESLAAQCIVIGEDLGTVPPGFRETLAQWGIWSYHVMLFERAPDGGFFAPELYRENAVATFATHDLATFAGWFHHRDLAVKCELGLDPGESDNDRAAAKDALGRAMAWRGLPTIDFPSVVKFLADTPSRLLVVSMEDVLGLKEQVNVPGTIEEHPNWRRRLPVDLDDLSERSNLVAVAHILQAAGRHTASRP